MSSSSRGALLRLLPSEHAPLLLLLASELAPLPRAGRGRQCRAGVVCGGGAVDGAVRPDVAAGARLWSGGRRRQPHRPAAAGVQQVGRAVGWLLGAGQGTGALGRGARSGACAADGSGQTALVMYMTQLRVRRKVALFWVVYKITSQGPGQQSRSYSALSGLRVSLPALHTSPQ